MQGETVSTRMPSRGRVPIFRRDSPFAAMAHALRRSRRGTRRSQPRRHNRRPTSRRNVIETDRQSGKLPVNQCARQHLLAGGGPCGASASGDESGGEPSLAEAPAGSGGGLPDERGLHAAGSSWLRALPACSQDPSRGGGAAGRPARPRQRLSGAPAAAPRPSRCADGGSGRCLPTHDRPCPLALKASTRIPKQPDGGPLR